MTRQSRWLRTRRLMPSSSHRARRKNHMPTAMPCGPMRAWSERLKARCVSRTR